MQFGRQLWLGAVLTESLMKVSLGGPSTQSLAWRNPGTDDDFESVFHWPEFDNLGEKNQNLFTRPTTIVSLSFNDVNNERFDGFAQRLKNAIQTTNLFMKLGFKSKQNVVNPLSGVLFNTMSPTIPATDYPTSWGEERRALKSKRKLLVQSPTCNVTVSQNK